mgnify:FL=1|tara:strand:+ start:28 stop:483 length:456 start_codon:yes stop_codon:yes gene_type:complete
MIKNLTFFLFFLILTNCGFSPIYYGNQNTDFKIEITNLAGDRDMNNLIKSNLIRYSDEDKLDVIKVKIYSAYNKKSLAKDTTGKTTDYRIETTFSFEAEINGKLKNININEAFDYRNIDDTIELIKYEDTVRQNIANTAVQKFISQVMRIE